MLIITPENPFLPKFTKTTVKALPQAFKKMDQNRIFGMKGLRFANHVVMKNFRKP
jgi:hypothetical protein